MLKKKKFQPAPSQLQAGMHAISQLHHQGSLGYTSPSSSPYISPRLTQPGICFIEKES